MIKFPKDDSYFTWTRHIKNKMIFYNLSEQKIKTILRSPTRREEGIAPETVAVMKRNDTKKRKEEIWVMYQVRDNDKKTITNDKIENIPSWSLSINRNSSSKKILISAWRYPGHTKPGSKIPIPDDILSELDSDDYLNKLK